MVAISKNTTTPATSTPAENAFAATLTVNNSATLGHGSVSPSSVPAYLSRQPILGYGSPAFQYALSHGGVNPAEWLSPSDISLFEKTTGGAINVADGSQANADLVFALCEMRNKGTFDGNNQPQLVQGAITASDMQGFINRYKDNTRAFNMDILNLNSALDTLNASARS